MKRKILIKIIILALILICLVSCATTRQDVQTPEEPKPIILQAGDESLPITFKKAIVKIPPGTTIGYHHDGLLRVPQFPYRWQTSVVELGEEYNTIANEELKSAGYDVAEREVTLFETKDDTWQAKYLLGGTINSLTLNTYAPLAGGFSESTMYIEWELYDVDLRKTICKFASSGTGITKTDGTFAMQEAFRYAMKNLLANEEFYALVVNKHEANASMKESTFKPIIVKVNNLRPTTEFDVLIKRATESVVTIKTEEGHGSGFFISMDGYIITNYHVIEGNNLIDIILFDNEKLQAKVVRVDQSYDLALLKINKSGISPLRIGDSSKIKTGEDVLAIGTPALLELGQSVSKGIVSGIRKYRGRDYIQTDAKINPGNSGGPLINSRGEVIGIIELKVVGLEFEGLAFALPMNIVKKRLNIVIK